MIFKDVLVAGSTLIREAIQSANYATGVSGWRIAQDGSAEFNNVVIRGGTTVSGTNLYYSGTPGLGTLFLAISPTAGTDVYGNTYQAGMNLYYNGRVQVIAGVGENSGGRGGVTSYLFDQNSWYYSALTAGIIELGIWDPVTGYPDFPAKLQFAEIENLIAGTHVNTLTVSSGGDGLDIGQARVDLQSASGSGVNDGIVNLAGARITYNGIDQGLGIVGSASVTSNVAFTSTETAVMLTPNITWQAGRIYRVDMDMLVMSDTASGFFNIQLRKGSVSGTVWRSQMRIESIPTSNTQNRYASFRAYLTPTTTFTSKLCLTATANGSSTGTISGNTTSSMSYMNVMDVGTNNGTSSPFVLPTYAANPIS